MDFYVREFMVGYLVDHHQAALGLMLPHGTAGLGAQEVARLLEAQRREIVNLTHKVRRGQFDVRP